MAKRVIVPGPSKLAVDPVELGLTILRVRTAKFSKRKIVLISLLFATGPVCSGMEKFSPGLASLVGIWALVAEIRPRLRASERPAGATVQ